MTFWNFCADYPLYALGFLSVCVWVIANVSNDICSAIRGRNEKGDDE